MSSQENSETLIAIEKHPGLQKLEDHWQPTILIPAFNARKETEACLHSIIANTAPPFQLLVIDDASSDDAVWPMLEAFASERDNVRLLRNEENLGFTRTVNRGFAECDTDVLLLNCDTLVTAGWLDRMISAAYSRPDVATVTPLSNAAGAFSAPFVNQVNEVPEELGADGMARLLARCSLGKRPHAPTGNGFCMYIRREVLNLLGGFDAENFPRGYGEENDFCMRAGKAGYVHLIEDSTYVFHHRSVSFGDEKTTLIEDGKRKIAELHPEYKPLIQPFLDDKDLAQLRSRLTVALENYSGNRAQTDNSKLRILSVLHAGGGGTIYTNADLMAALKDNADTYVLACDLREWQLLDVATMEVIRRYRFPESWRADAGLSDSRIRTMRSIVGSLDLDIVHFRNLIGTGPELIPAVKNTGVRVVVSFHDFAMVCPTIQLLDAESRYCAGDCTPDGGSCEASQRWFPGITDLKHNGVYDWRVRMAANLRSADAFITTSHVAHDVIVKHYPALETRPFHIIEHGRDDEGYSHIGVAPDKKGPIRVVAFGALGPSKGTAIIEELIRLNAEENGPFEFHILGNVWSGFNPASQHCVLHGAYERDALPQELAKLQPSFSLIASIWPETYCHTLTESWMAGVPVFASDIGVLRERIDRHGGGWLLDYQDPASWYRDMVSIAQTPQQWQERINEISAIKFPRVADMAAQYVDVYQEIIKQ